MIDVGLYFARRREILTYDERTASEYELRALVTSEQLAAGAVLERYRNRKRLPRRAVREISGHTDRMKAGAALVGALAADRREAEISKPIRPRWDRVSAAARIIDRRVLNDPGARARADGMLLSVREHFTAQGLDVESPEVQYVALVAVGLMVEWTSNGVQAGEVGAPVLSVVAKVAQTFTAALLPLLPEEARR